MSVIFINQPKCPFCGEYLSVISGCCAHCGHPIPQTYNMKAFKEGIIISLIIVAVFFLIFLLMF
jgi:predicted amidophosphoribosyltransferase